MSEPVKPPQTPLELLVAEIERRSKEVTTQVSRLREVQQIQVAALETLDRKVERILMKLEHRDG